MRFVMRPLLALIVILCGVRLLAEEEITGLFLNDNSAAYEGHLWQALGLDSALPNEKSAAPAPLDPQAAALQRGDWRSAYCEANAAAESADPLLAARGKARGALVLARLGLPHMAISRVNEALAEPAARGEVMLARAWMLWQVGAFKFADSQFELALAAHPAPPDWMISEWKKLRTARAKDAAAYAALEEPEDPASPAYLDYADKARAAGAFNEAASLYTQAVGLLQQSAEPGAPRANLDRAYHGLRESLLGAVGGKLPGADYPNMRTVVLLTARQIAQEGGQRSMWEAYFKLLAETLPDRGQLDYAQFNLAADLALAERQGGVGPEWRERFRPLLSDPKLRFATQVQQAVARAEKDPAYSLAPEVADTAQLEALVGRITQDEAMLEGLRSTLPAGVEPLSQEIELAQIATVMRLRLALARKDRVAAETQLALVRADGDHMIERPEYRRIMDENERQELVESLDQLDKFELKAMPADLLARAVDGAKRAEARLSARLGVAIFHPDRMVTSDREEVARIREVKLLAAAHAGQVLLAESELSSLEQWCKSMPDYKRLEAAQITVLGMEAKAEPLTPEEQTIADAIAADRPDASGAQILSNINQYNPYRLASRLLLARLHWALCQDDLAEIVIADLRKKAPVNDAFREQLNELMAKNDTRKICEAIIARLGSVIPAERRSVAQQAERELAVLRDRYDRRYNAGKPIPRDMVIGNASYPYQLTLAAIGCTQAAQGNLRAGVERMTRISNESVRRYLTDVPFRHDLPNVAAVKAWRDLLADRELPKEELEAVHKVMLPLYGRSLTADLALALLRVRNREFTKAKDVVAALRERYGFNTSYAAQLDQLDYLIARKSELVILFESSEQVRREREIAQYNKQQFVSANFDAIKETYQADGQSSETRHVEALEKRIDDLATVASDIDQRNEQKLNAAEQSKSEAQTRALANLRRLTL